MKKIAILISSMALGFTAGNVMADTGGFVGPGVQTKQVAKQTVKLEELVKKATTVKNAKTLNDDTDVVLRGHINKAVENERYEFEDATGTIILDLQDRKWDGLRVTPKDKIIIVGEIDRDRNNNIEVDVDKVMLDK